MISEEPYKKEVLPRKEVIWLNLAVIASYFLVAIVSVLYALLKLCRPGISKEGQKIVLVRHVLSIFVFIIAQLYVFICFVYRSSPYLYTRGYDDNTSVFIAIFKVLFESQGIYVPLIRLSEPFFFSVIWQNVKDILNLVFCCRRKKQ